MKKVRGNYPDEFINELTEEFLSGGMANYDVDRVREKIKKLRQENHCAIFLEMHFAVISILLEDSIEASKRLRASMELDEFVIDCHVEEARLLDLIIGYLDRKPVELAKAGGAGRSAKFKILETETVRLYELGNWKSIPIAAQEITPRIVALSKDSNGDLLPSTTKPLEWIRAFRKSQKSNLS
jgi:hypothetical protein